MTARERSIHPVEIPAPAPAAAAMPTGGLDAINLGAWRHPETVRLYRDLSGYTDPGEKAALDRVAPEVSGTPILDIGVGCGRTTELLRPISEDYTAIDYTQEMVAACQARHPGVRVLHMDARQLDAFADGHFGLVVFSYNGIDSVDLDARGRVLSEIHRVLRPGGLAVLSAHNRLGPNCGEQPRLDLRLTWNPVRLGWRTLKALRSLVNARRNHQRLAALNEAHEDWAVMNCAAHDFGIVIVYTTLAEQKRQFAAAGLRVEAVFDNVRGEAVTDTQNTSSLAWFHYVVRKPGPD